MRQVLIFARIRLVLKFRHRSLQWYRSHQKIFIELGDTALQSWTNFGKSGEISRLLVDFVDPGACCWPKVVETRDQIKKKSFWFFSYSKNRFIELVLHTRILYINSNDGKKRFLKILSLFMCLAQCLIKFHWKIERFGCIYRPRTRAAQPKSSENSINYRKYRKTEFFNHLNLAKVCVYVMLAR